MSKRILMIDLDGVCADFDTEIRKIHPTIFEHEDEEYRGKIIDEIVEADVHLFERLLPIDGAIEAVTRLSNDFDIYFLSTPMWNVPESFMDKRLWVEKYFGEIAKKKINSYSP